MSPHEWHPEDYDRLAGGIMALGREVVGRLPLRGDETVLDAGCGTGRVTEALALRLSRGRVIALDASEAMVEAARRRLAAAGLDERATYVVGDLLDLELDEPVDAILSTATLHWVGDHDRLFARLRAALRPGGRLVAQCGGAGNIAAQRDAAAEVVAREPFAEYLAGFDPWRFELAGRTEERLRAAGFYSATCWLEVRPVEADPPEDYYAEMLFGAHLELLPRTLHRRFVEEVARRVEDPGTVRYVRLNIDAVA
jgi:trans-aconitate 2-methyltransferase